eukprot:CAMPEP_0180361438 /NCGR_PEP_ID=MMETSP0989-20121125/12635_1 /TAXON_ID=697907 /ORGANISM="non described non described, Strain CCMP2293" /LENGTH=93 /DNA_ID=CAMNT_0022353093 /DNA_START=194 /DNA_END=475 /DNA_ORIENTATION=+
MASRVAARGVRVKRRLVGPRAPDVGGLEVGVVRGAILVRAQAVDVGGGAGTLALGGTERTEHVEALVRDLDGRAIDVKRHLEGDELLDGFEHC